MRPPRGLGSVSTATTRQPYMYLMGYIRGWKADLHAQCRRGRGAPLSQTEQTCRNARPSAIVPAQDWTLHWLAFGWEDPCFGEPSRHVRSIGTGGRQAAAGGEGAGAGADQAGQMQMRANRRPRR